MVRMTPGGAGSAWGHVAVVGVAFALLVVLLPVGAAGSVDAGQPIRPDHGPILIRGDGDLVLPDPVSGNGIRRGIGTEDRPYVIEDWTIREDGETRAAIRIESTTLHLVIQHVDFEWPDLLPRIEIVDAENVTVRDLRLDAPDNGSRPIRVIDADHLRRSRISGIRMNGSGYISVSYGRDVLLEDLYLSGWETGFRLAGGEYRMQDIEIRARPFYGEYGAATSGNLLLAPTNRPMESCQLDAQNVTIRQAFERGIEILGPGCRASLRNMRISSSEIGMDVGDGAEVSIANAGLERGPRDRLSRDPRGPGLDHRHAGLYVHNGALLEAEAITVDSYYHGITSSGSTVHVEDSHLTNHTTAIHLTDTCTPCHVHNSSLLSTGEMLVVNDGPSTLDARWNWWGSPEGPDPARFAGAVLYEPWRTEGPVPPARQEALPSLGAWGLVAVVVAAALGTARRRS